MNFSVSWRPKPFYTSKVTRCPNSLQTINLLSSLMSLPRCFADQVSLKLNSTFSYDVNCWGLHPLSFSVKQDHIMLSDGWILSTCLSLSFIICSHPSRMWDKPGPADQLLLSAVGGVSHYRKRSFIHSAKPSSVEIRESQIRSCPTEETHTRHKAAPTHTNKHTRLQIWCTWLISSWSSSQVRICAASILDGVHVFDVWHLDIISGCVWEHGACVCCFVVCCHRATMQSSNPKWSKSKVKAKTSLVCLP